MKESSIKDIIEQALLILENEIGLTKATLKVVASRSFKPIADFFDSRNEANYNDELINELENLYQESLRNGSISRNVYNIRTRGTRILREVFCTGTFHWKGPVDKGVVCLPEKFERIVAGIFGSNRLERRERNTLTVVKRFLLSLTDEGINDISQVKAEHVQAFLGNISETRAKSMDDVIGSLRKLDRYLTATCVTGLPYAGLLMAPRARERRIYPYMPQDELSLIMQSIDRNTTIGKRDYAILLLSLSSGMRAGDVASIKLTDIDWHMHEIRIVQGKTQNPVNLPMHRGVGSALADYILNGRPKSKSPQIFLRVLAPYQRFKDGVSVACILRRRMKAVGIPHEPGDGRTMHGIRRMLGTHMTIEGVPVTTVAQVLGHQNTDSTRQYISLDIEGLRECALGFGSLGEGLK